MLDAVGPGLQQYIFCSSAGVYKKSEQMPHREEDDVDFNSRHKVGPAGGCFGCGRCLGAVGCRGSQHSVVPCVTCDAGVALRAAHAASTARSLLTPPKDELCLCAAASGALISGELNSRALNYSSPASPAGQAVHGGHAAAARRELDQRAPRVHLRECAACLLPPAFCMACICCCGASAAAGCSRKVRPRSEAAEGRAAVGPAAAALAALRPPMRRVAANTLPFYPTSPPTFTAHNRFFISGMKCASRPLTNRLQTPLHPPRRVRSTTTPLRSFSSTA